MPYPCTSSPSSVEFHWYFVSQCWHSTFLSLSLVSLLPWSSLPVLDNAHPCLKCLLVSGIPGLLVTTGGPGMMRSLSLFSVPLPCTHYFSHTREGQAFKQLKPVVLGWYRLPDRQLWRHAESSQTSYFWRLIVMGIKSTLLITWGINLLSYPVHMTKPNKVLQNNTQQRANPPPLTVPALFLFGIPLERSHVRGHG